MKTLLVFFSVVLIWSTTPLAIKWSGEEVGPFFGIMSRMIIALLVCFVLHAMSRHALPIDKYAWRNYLAAGFGLYMITLVYWGAQHINSGVVSLIFGLTPVVTALLAHLWLGERIGLYAYLGLFCGIFGLLLLFYGGVKSEIVVSLGMLSVLLAVFCHAVSSIWVKRLGVKISPLASTTGGLLVAMPFYILAWLLSAEPWPSSLQNYTIFSIVYLAIMGSVLGFSLYYYLLKRVSASHAALITFLTPILALFIGVNFNDEKLTWTILAGAGFILFALAVFHFSTKYVKRR